VRPPGCTADPGDISGDLIGPIETDHGRLKSRLRPMHGLKRLRSPQVITGWRFPHRLATASPNSHSPSDLGGTSSDVMRSPRQGNSAATTGRLLPAPPPTRRSAGRAWPPPRARPPAGRPLSRARHERDRTRLAAGKAGRWDLQLWSPARRDSTPPGPVRPRRVGGGRDDLLIFGPLECDRLAPLQHFGVTGVMKRRYLPGSHDQLALGDLHVGGGAREPVARVHVEAFRQRDHLS
jgi:hypothetical protein